MSYPEMYFSKKTALIAAATLLTVLLHGCGGGGSPTSSPTPATPPTPPPTTLSPTTPPPPTPTPPPTTPPPTPRPTPTSVDPLCASHAACKGLDGYCCPTPIGDWLGCCPEKPGPEPGTYACTSETKFPTAEIARKGLALDDITFSTCASEIPYLFPNTDENVSALRVFSSWPFFGNPDKRPVGWHKLAAHVKATGVKIMLGTTVTCVESDDDKDWAQLKELMQLLGPENIMGVSIGNEMDLLWEKDYIKYFPDCITKMWEGGYYWKKTKDRAMDLKALGGGFESLPLTSTISGAAVMGNPFVENHNAKIITYLNNARSTFGSQWVFTFNLYSFFHPFELDAGTTDQCNAAVHLGTCWNAPECIMIKQLIELRQKLTQLTGRHDDRLWLGEVGWSSPQPDFFKDFRMGHCPAFSSTATFAKYYSLFLKWDLKVPGTELLGPERVFYFTIRDASQFGMSEHFGLIEGCGAQKCKIRDRVTNETSDLVI